MDPTDVPIQPLQRIQESLAKLEGHAEKSNERLAAIDAHLVEHGERLEAVEAAVVHVVDRTDATNAAIGVLTEQVKFFGRAATAAAEARLRLDDRVDVLDEQVQRLKARVDAIAPEHDG